MDEKDVTNFASARTNQGGSDSVTDVTERNRNEYYTLASVVSKTP